ncbi:MAG: VWA domain-containing protein [Burkholderiales bacterium]|nr:VWA domain-containing protein [Burkholderiales bacterium]
MRRPDSAGTTTGALARNVVHFVRLLRGAGVRAGPSATLAALGNVEAAGIEERADVKAALRAALVSRADQRLLFDIAFDMFWCDPKLQEKMLSALLPGVQGRGAEPAPPPPARLTDAYQSPPQPEAHRLPNQTEELEFDAALTFSASEKLQRMDFEQMNAAEWEAARHAITRLALPVKPLNTRRLRARSYGRIDLKACLRDCQRSGGELLHVPRAAPDQRPPALVVLCDISGSMHRYTRMFLHFVHALSNCPQRSHADRPGKIEVFLFGTRLTHVTRHLRGRDVDVALDSIAAAAPDWSGGTRIGACLEEFNLRWSRRVLSHGASVLLLSDGLDRDDTGRLAAAAERLGKSCRTLIWLNPLLRYEAFEPRAAGVRAILPHVDAFVPVHNLAAISDLALALAGATPGRSDLRVAHH